MAMSGVQIEENCVDAYAQVKSNKLKCCTFRLTDDSKRIQICEESQLKFTRGKPDAAQFKEFIKLFPENECRYAVFHVIIALKGSDGIPGERDRIVFVSWAPDTAKIKAKMLHSASKDAIKKKFEGIGIEFQMSCPEEMQAGEWIAKLQDLPNIKMSGDIFEFEGQSISAWEDES